MKKGLKAFLVLTACLCMILTMVPSTAYAEGSNTLTLPVRVCEYTECEGGMDYVYLDHPEYSATFTADDPTAILSTSVGGGYTGVMMDYIGSYEATYNLEAGYNRFCVVNISGYLSESQVTGTLTIPVPSGCDAASAKYAVYTMDESFNYTNTPFTAVSSYTDNTVSIPYYARNNVGDYILFEYVSTEPISYLVVEGMNSTWTAGSADGLTVRANGVLDKFQSVKVDGTVVDPSNYTATSGSTIITFKKEYMDTLSEGTHAITIVFTDGEASTNVTLAKTSQQTGTGQNTTTQTVPAKKDDVPKTGESDSALLWFALAVCSGAGMIIVYRKKKSDFK